MTRRERFKAAMERRSVDRPPYDLAGTSLTQVDSPKALRELKASLGITGEPVTPYAKFDERILDALDIDFRRVGDIIIPHTSHEKSGDGWFIDAYGIKRVFAGRYYEISDYPLRGATLKELREYEFPDPDTLDDGIFEAYGKTAKYLYENTDYVIVGEHPVFGVLEIACWMCGFDDFLYRMAAEPEFVHEFFALTLRFQKKLIERYYDKIGRYIHITTSGDDFGTQRAPFVSAAMFDELIAPYFKERIAYTKQFTDAYFFHHTCGSVYKLIGSLIDCGVEILNPIQPTAADMEPAKLHAAFGDRIAFWGGIDTQELLVNGSPDDVRAAVSGVIRAMDAHNGGYILAPAHCIQDDVPGEKHRCNLPLSRWMRTACLSTARRTNTAPAPTIISRLILPSST